MIKLFVIDDHFLIIEGLYRSFEAEVTNFTVVGSASTIKDAIETIPLCEPEIIILDLFLQFSDPVSNCQQLRARFPSLPIVILSYENSLEWQLEMFKQGVKAYVSKNDTQESIDHVLYEVAHGQTVLPDSILEHLIIQSGKIKGYSLTAEMKSLISDLRSGLELKEMAEKHQRSISSIEKTLRKLRADFHAKTNCELIDILTRKHY